MLYECVAMAINKRPRSLEADCSNDELVERVPRAVMGCFRATRSLAALELDIVKVTFPEVADSDDHEMSVFEADERFIGNSYRTTIVFIAERIARDSGQERSLSVRAVNGKRLMLLTTSIGTRSQIFAIWCASCGISGYVYHSGWQIADKRWWSMEICMKELGSWQCMMPTRLRSRITSNIESRETMYQCRTRSVVIWVKCGRRV